MSKITCQVLMVIACVCLISLILAPAASSAPMAAQKEKQPAEGLSPGWQGEWDKVLKGARKEGKLTVYSSPGGELIREMGKNFGDKFGVNVEFVLGRGAELEQRVVTELSAELHIADVVIAGGTSFTGPLRTRSFLSKLDPLLLLPEVTDPAAWITDTIPYMNKNRTVIGMLAQYYRFISYNTDAVKAGEITSYRDLLNPKWKNKIVMDDPTIAGTCNTFLRTLVKDVWGLEKTKEVMRQLVKQEPVITRDRRLQTEWVVRGKYPLGLGLHTQAAILLIKAGGPLAFAKASEGSKIDTGGGAIVVPKKNPHPNAATAFVNWILSREGHAKFVKAYGSPGARRDAPREGIFPALFPDAGEKIFVETEESLLFREEMSKISREIFKPLLE